MAGIGAAQESMKWLECPQIGGLLRFRKGELICQAEQTDHLSGYTKVVQAEREAVIALCRLIMSRPLYTACVALIRTRRVCAPAQPSPVRSAHPRGGHSSGERSCRSAGWPRRSEIGRAH